MKNEKKYDLITLGELLLRLSPVGEERLTRGNLFSKEAGGAELNVAAGVSMLGLDTAVISKLPDNAMGYFMKNCISACGVSGDCLIYDDAPDARLGIYYYEKGATPRKPAVVYDRKYSSINHIKLSDIPEEVYGSTKCFHTTGITLALGGTVRETAIEMIKRFKEAGALISFDVNFRANLWGEDEARETIERILPYVDIFFCSETTSRLTFGKSGTVREMMKSFTEEYPISVVASTERTVHSPKCHTFGSVIYDAGSDTYFEEEPYRNIEVIDRIGSGDAYIAGVLYGLLAHGGDCLRALEYGNASSAIKNTVPGDLPSVTLREADKIIASHKKDNGAEMDR